MMNMLIVFNTIENVKKIRNFIKYLYLELLTRLSTVKEFSGVLHCYAVRYGSASPFKYFYSIEQERNNGILLHFVCVFTCDAHLRKLNDSH